jgi:transcriptional regulator with PAS, ATPase and Fis domain
MLQPSLSSEWESTPGNTAILAPPQQELYRYPSDGGPAWAAEAAAALDRLKQFADFPPFIIASPCMLKLVADIWRARNSSAPALITGETGTGKELIARAVHALSPVRGRNFVAQNCAEFIPGLIESELFGHRRGSFTGADRDRKGLIREAEGGTLFLDEIGELNSEMQKVFLRFLQEREVRPVGADNPIKANARIIAATNRDLEAELNAGRFRADLYERFNVLPLPVPPLRERREEIPLLIDHFLDLHRQREHRQGVRLSEEALGLMIRYDWPRNVRQLANEVYRLVLLAHDNDTIGAASLSDAIRTSVKAPSAPAAAIVGGNVVIDLSLPLREAKDRMERLFIVHDHQQHSAIRLVQLHLENWHEHLPGNHFVNEFWRRGIGAERRAARPWGEADRFLFCLRH